MNLLEWAKNEVELACKRESPNREEGEWDYGCACYESALKAFESLCNDGHSGMSIQITKQILNRLIDVKPLTPIEDTEDVWNSIVFNTNTEYQCKRMSSLFKKICNDGTIKYSDVNRIICTNINTGITYTNGFISNLVDDMFPITMPYIPSDIPIKVYCEEFLTDKKNGDFDTVGILYLIKDDNRININRYFKDDWQEISFAEYKERKSIAIDTRNQIPN